MSQSPATDQALKTDDYLYGWLALSQLLSEGKSFSGREANCSFLNLGNGAFADVSAVSGLDFIDDSRAFGIVDWDLDGRLDIWTSSRTSPRTRFLRNVLTTNHHFLAIRLQGVTCNRDAIGARIELYLGGESNRKLIRTLRAGEGFIGQSSKWIHFGLGSATDIQRIVVQWPGGASETFTNLETDQRSLVVQGTGTAKRLKPSRPAVELTSVPLSPQPVSQQQRIVLSGRIPVPNLPYTDDIGRPARLRQMDSPVLVNLWAHWCQPCVSELSELVRLQPELKHAGVNVVALSVDEPVDHEKAVGILERFDWPYESGIANSEILDGLDIIQRILLMQRVKMPLPTSFLIDANGALAAIYKGPINATELLEDVGRLKLKGDAVLSTSLPFSGRWHQPPPVAGSSLIELVFEFLNAGYPQIASDYLPLLASNPTSSDGFESRELLAIAHLNLGTKFARIKKFDAALTAFHQAVKIDPQLVNAHVGSSQLLAKAGRVDAAIQHLQRAVEIEPDRLAAHQDLARLLRRRGRLRESVQHSRRVIELDPASSQAHFNLASVYILEGAASEALQHLDRALRLQPNWVPAMNTTARILATHPDPELRNADRAVRLAQRAAQLTGRKDVATLDTLSAAYAAAGKFKLAASTAETALQLAVSNKQPKAAARIRARLGKYQQRGGRSID